MSAGQQRPVVLNQLGSETRALIAELALPVEVINAPDALPWTLAGQADVLFTAPRHSWRLAPEQAPEGWPGRLQWVHLASAGIDYFPPWLSQVPLVTCSRGVAAAPIAEYVFAALLDYQKSWPGLVVADSAQWRQTFDRVFQQPLGMLQGQTLGLAGYGAISQAIARRAQAFDMKVVALRRSTTGSDVDADGTAFVATLPELLAQSDHAVLALPLTAHTRHIINTQSLAHAKPGLHLVNIARGALIDQPALLQALDEGRLSYATLDVTDPEPLPDGHPLYHHPKVRLTPHISWSADGTAVFTARKFAEKLARFVAGQELDDRVDFLRGY